MDPTPLASIATAFLVPLLSKVGQDMAGQAGKKLPEHAQKIWDAIRAKFKGKPAAEGSADELQAKPDDQDNQEAFALQLKKALTDDPAFAEEIAKLLQSAQKAGEMAPGVSGAVAGQGGVAAGQIHVGRDVGGNLIVGNHNRVIGRGTPPDDDDRKTPRTDA